MSTKWYETSWQKEFLEMKFHSISDVKLLTKGVKGIVRCLSFRCLASGIQKTEENKRGE